MKQTTYPGCTWDIGFATMRKPNGEVEQVRTLILNVPDYNAKVEEGEERPVSEIIQFPAIAAQEELGAALQVPLEDMVAGAGGIVRPKTMPTEQQFKEMAAHADDPLGINRTAKEAAVKLPGHAVPKD